MKYQSPYLQKYKGKATRHTCPSCGRKQSFTLYTDGNTHEPIHPTVGKCNRESKCGYHYTPKQYFIDNPINSACTEIMLGVSKSRKSHALSPLKRVGARSGKVSFSYVEQSASYKSNFVRFLCEFLTTEQITYIGDNYALGATNSKEVIFWQIDTAGRVRTGKIMQYNPETGKRLKHENGAIDWVHNRLKKSNQFLEDFNLRQCFFGEHLLTICPDKSVAIVESEKSALIASALIPNMIWLAAGNINGLTLEKCRILENREIILYPDLGAFEKWSLKAEEIRKNITCKISVSNLLENIANGYDRANGYDIADFIISELNSKNTGKEIQKSFSPTLQDMIDKNKALMILINELNLVEI